MGFPWPPPPPPPAPPPDGVGVLAGPVPPAPDGVGVPEGPESPPLPPNAEGGVGVGPLGPFEPPPPGGVGVAAGPDPLPAATTKLFGAGAFWRIGSETATLMPLTLTVSVVPSLEVKVLSGLVFCPLAAIKATACESYAIAARASIAVL